MNTAETTDTPAEKPATAEVRCAFCRGTGTDPFNLLSSRSRCEVCRGKGVVRVPAERVRCAFCGGDGSFKTFCCPVCRGKGAVPAVAGPTRVCGECGGRACDGSSGLPCLACRGRGRVPAPTHTSEG